MSVTPQNIHADPHYIKLIWDDGEQTLDAYKLRCACECANCVSETTGKRTLDPNSVSKEVTITHAEPTGHYALTLNFSDGHATGIYTYESLKKLS